MSKFYFIFSAVFTPYFYIVETTDKNRAYNLNENNGSAINLLAEITKEKADFLQIMHNYKKVILN